MLVQKRKVDKSIELLARIGRLSKEEAEYNADHLTPCRTNYLPSDSSEAIRRHLSKEISKIVKATTRIDAANAEILFAMERIHQLMKPID